MRPRLLVHPKSSYRYYSFYLQGLCELLGQPEICFTNRGMPTLSNPKDGLAAVTDDGLRVFVAANDHETTDAEALAWSDRYGQVNLPLYDPLPANLLALGPSFGIRWHGRGTVLLYVVRSGLRLRSPRLTMAMLRDYDAHQRDRAPLDCYTPQPSDPDYLFFRATAWRGHDRVNQLRADLLSAARRSPGLVVDAAFVEARADPRSLTHREYLERTKQSVAVLNTPALHGCLGWKLGEFLALGKAIISLPLTRRMPSPLRHGIHVHYVDGSQESVTDASGAAAKRPRLPPLSRSCGTGVLAPLAASASSCWATARGRPSRLNSASGRLIRSMSSVWRADTRGCSSAMTRDARPAG